MIITAHNNTQVVYKIIVEMGYTFICVQLVQ